MAVIKAVDEYADLMRVSAASAGNDHRLGGNEAPPAIVSIFLGDELTEVLKSIENDTYFGNHGSIQLETGAHVLPHFIKDTTDRNRTSPFAFTGNKFEFRMLGSSASVAGPNVILNTAVAEALAQFYEELKSAEGGDMEHAVHELIKRAIKKHKKIIFNGNGYTDEWIQEAEKRGLYNLVSTPDALPAFIEEKNMDLFIKHHIFTKDEIYSRYEIFLENYIKTVEIEAKTLKEMVTKDFLPSAAGYAAETAENAQSMKAFAASVPVSKAEELVNFLGNIYEKLSIELDTLSEEIQQVESREFVQETADYCHKTLLSTMENIRCLVNLAEEKIPDEMLPYPTYDTLLFSV